ncbi:hypothetical protein KR009_004589 [Drosophila setifemur]|nr:hypothetical protein KR009_004589 [Drosophila setifemur]
MEKFLAIYHGYALVIGMSSCRFENGRLTQTRLTQAYAIAINTLVIGLLPIAYRITSRIGILDGWMPTIVIPSLSVIYLFNYSIMLFVVISRFNRDSILMDLQNLTCELNRKITKSKSEIDPKLRRLFYLKFFIFAYICVTSFTVICLVFFGSEPIGEMLMNTEYNIRNVTIYSYFTSFWQISKGFDFINQQLEKLASSKCRRRQNVREIRDLWDLHSRLSHMAQRISRIYSLQMLVGRLDYMVFSIIYGYVGIVLMRPSFYPLKYFAGLVYILRTIDYFLNDYICELTTRYQSQPKPRITEGKMCKELSAYLIYESSMRLDLKVCGLFSVNRNQWLGTAEFINGQSILFLQLYRAMKNDY